MRMWSVRRLALVVTLVTSLGGGCDDGNNGGGHAGGGSGGDKPLTGTTKGDAGCRQPGPLTEAMLPTVSESEYRKTANPCVPLVGLLDQIGQLIPPGEEQKVAGFAKFIEKAQGFVGAVSALNDVATCGYQTDRLAIVFYQDQRNVHYWYSMGLVAVIRGRLGAAADVAACFIKQELGITGGTKFRSDAPTINPCQNSVWRFRDGQDYLVMYVGSTTEMCGLLTGQLDPQSKARGTVLGSPTVIVRGTPSTQGAVVGRAPHGMTGVVLCRTEGESVTDGKRTSSVWLRMTINGYTGFASAVYIDTGGDVTQQTKPCA